MDRRTIIMVEPAAVKRALRKGVVIGFVGAILLLGTVIGAPVWWFSSGRDAQTLHDGLSASFRGSLAEILTVGGYAAKRSAYDESVTITARDDVLKYGTQPVGEYHPGPLANYIGWQQETELNRELLNAIYDGLDNPSMQLPANRQLLMEEKAQAYRVIENMKTDHSMLTECGEAIRQMVSDRTMTTAPRCLPVPDRH
jgi:hypothetical protein